MQQVDATIDPWMPLDAEASAGPVLLILGVFCFEWRLSGRASLDGTGDGFTGWIPGKLKQQAWQHVLGNITFLHIFTLR